MEKSSKLLIYSGLLLVLGVSYLYMKKNNICSTLLFIVPCILITMIFLYTVFYSPFYSSSIIKNGKSTILKVTHNAGFFSCCSIKLNDILVYFNLYKHLPTRVDSSCQFSWYKNGTDHRDITYDYFKPVLTNTITFVDKIKYHHDDQYAIYKNLPLATIIPFVTTYFTPSDYILSLKQTIKDKYNIDPSMTCVLFYRGNDKNTETRTCSYEDIITYGKQIETKYPSMRFMIQSDETDFINTMTSCFSNSFVCTDEIRHMNNKHSTVDKVYKNDNSVFSKNYLAITLLMAECNYLVCGSGNCSIWIIFYRQHTNHVYQFLRGTWYIS